MGKPTNAVIDEMLVPLFELSSILILPPPNGVVSILLLIRSFFAGAHCIRERPDKVVVKPIQTQKGDQIVRCVHMLIWRYCSLAPAFARPEVTNCPNCPKLVGTAAASR